MNRQIVPESYDVLYRLSSWLELVPIWAIGSSQIRLLHLLRNG